MAPSATAADLPCDGDGVCMICNAKVSESESLVCKLCATPWHVPCLSAPPETMASAVNWKCPDCSGLANAASSLVSSGLIASVKAIEADRSLTEQEKARRRQELLGGSVKVGEDEEDRETKKTKRTNDDLFDLLDQKFNCSFCLQLPDRPVTSPCGHNFCLKCFQKWVGQGKNACAKCRAPIPSKMASLPRINSALVMAIRMAKTTKPSACERSTQVYYFMHNKDRPDKAFTTERAKKAGKANACSGQVFVTIPSDYLGPITAEHDPKRRQGILVGETWEDRMECRQWGAHFPHVGGIAGQSDYGAQSVALSGGYEDDEDHGDWFLYTGSGGRDLSGNKRTNKEHAFDQKFEKYNKALRVSCCKGYPVRVVRSHKEKRSSYASETGVRYDGIYRIEKCWRKVGSQGFKMCRYLFVRCDNEPAPWTSNEHGDRPRTLPVIKELKAATDITERKESPAWDYDDKVGWKWVKPPPPSKKSGIQRDPKDGTRIAKVIRKAHNASIRGKLLKEFGCLICRDVMRLPLTTPCAHNFCKSCLLDSYGNLSFVKERTRENGRTLRSQKVVNKCPCCPTDISEFLQNPQINRDMMDLIESLQREAVQENVDESRKKDNDNVGGDQASVVIEKSGEEASDPAEKNTCPDKFSVPKQREYIKKRNVEKDCQPVETERDGATLNCGEHDTTVENHINNCQTKLDDNDGSFRLDPSTSLRKRNTCDGNRSTKRLKKDGKKDPQEGNNTSTVVVSEMLKASESNDRSKIKAHNPTARCKSRYLVKWKKPDTQPVSRVQTRSMKTKTGSASPIPHDRHRAL